MAEMKTNKTQIGGQKVNLNAPKITHTFDQLKMFFGEPYDVGNGMTIYQPTIGQILEVGEQAFYGTLYTFISNPTTYRLQLWDMGVDWNKIKAYDLFAMLAKSVDSKVASVMFGDIDFAGFDLYQKTVMQPDEDGEEKEVTVVTLYNKDADIEIDEEHYTIISEYLQTMFNIFPKVEKAKGKATKEAIIEEERLKLTQALKKGDEWESGLMSLISACINHPGFKYKLQELKDVGICQFMDSVQRLQVYESSTALLHGMMGGFVDSSKIKSDDYNWMRSLNNG